MSYPQQSPSVVQSWLAECCTLRMQATLLVALRGCDGIRKDDPSKPITRELRKRLLNPADPDWRDDPNNNFLRGALTKEAVDRFLNDIDHYPLHWVMHLVHAVHIMAAQHPENEVRRVWRALYDCLCDRLHLPPETDVSLRERLADGRRTQLVEKGLEFLP